MLLELYFFQLHGTVAGIPWSVLISCVVFTLISSFSKGLLAQGTLAVGQAKRLVLTLEVVLEE